MAVTKAQLVVWALIAGFSAAGYSVLSRVKLPERPTAAAPMAAVVKVVPAPAPVAPVKMPAVAAPVAVAANELPQAIPEFPFPDDLVPASTVATMAGTVDAFAPVAHDAIPQIATVAQPEVAAIESPEPVVAPEMRAEVAAAEEPPIPMPSRPVVAQPVKAVPLAEVKTLYVVADALNVRAVPSTSGAVLQKVPQGFAVAARERSNEWIGFLMRDGSTGWMRTDFLSDTMPPQATTASATSVWTEPLNLMM